MSLTSAPYYWVECDNCGTRCEYGDFAAWAEPGQALDGARDYDWSAHGDRHHCPGCPPLCETCGQSAGDDYADRDGECQPCWDKAEAAAGAS